jgi:hypothetical protein
MSQPSRTDQTAASGASVVILRTVSVLCAARNSVYREMEGVDVYDIDRDARTFDGSTPIVGHPPCRAWSAYCAHQAKPAEGEKDLGLWVCEQLKACGGVLEHPEHSRLFDAAGLPKPGEAARDGLWSAAVLQAWWGDSRRKATWLCFSSVPREAVDIPLRLRASDAGDRRRWQVMSKHQRSATCRAFAEWLVSVARRAG